MTKPEEFKLGVLYFTKILDNKYHLSFRADYDESLKHHSHFFLQRRVGKDDDWGIPIDEAFKIFYILKDLEEPFVKGVTDICLQIGFSYESKKDWNDCFIEFLVIRELTQELFEKMGAWIEIVLENMDDISVIDEQGEILIE